MTRCESEGDAMHQRGQTTRFQVRFKIMEQASAGLNDTQIATGVGWTLWTVRKWRRRSLKGGRVGFTSQMGCPATGSMSTFALSIPLPFASFLSSLRSFAFLIPFPLASFLLSWCLLLPVYVRLALSPFHMRLFSLI